VCGAAVQGNLLPGDGLYAGDDTDVVAFLREDRSLLDVALDVGERRVQACATLALEADAD
jgi:hypothetical protein